MENLNNVNNINSNNEINMEYNQNTEYINSSDRTVNSKKNENFHNYDFSIFAGFWIRFCAYLVDLIVLGSFVRIIKSPLILIIGTDRLSIGFFELTLAAILLPVYFVLFTKLSNGQTPGKMIFGLKVVCFNEEKLSWQTVIIRELFGRYINKAILFLYIITAFTPKKQHAVDYLTDTSVISISNLSIWEKAQNL